MWPPFFGGGFIPTYAVADPGEGKGGANAPPFEGLPSRALSNSAQT